jgi:hypothetical protein
MSFENSVYQAHLSGKLDLDLVELFLPSGQIKNIEGPMWDYKVGFCHPNAVIHEEALLTCEILNDIAALYNAFGGYALQLMSSSSFEELMEVLSEDRQSLQASLLRMSQFHLFAGSGDLATGSQISVPEPVRLMVKITEGKLSDGDAQELRTRSAKAVGRAKDGQSELGKRLRGISLLAMYR